MYPLTAYMFDIASNLVPQVVSIVRFYWTYIRDLTIETTLIGPTGGLDCEVLLDIH